MWLTDEEVYELTRKKRYPAQIRALRAMGIECKPRGDGSPAVMRSHVDKLFGGNASATVTKEYPFGHIKRATSAQA